MENTDPTLMDLPVDALCIIMSYIPSFIGLGRVMLVNKPLHNLIEAKNFLGHVSLAKATDDSRCLLQRYTFGRVSLPETVFDPLLSFLTQEKRCENLVSLDISEESGEPATAFVSLLAAGFEFPKLQFLCVSELSGFSKVSEGFGLGRSGERLREYSLPSLKVLNVSGARFDDTIQLLLRAAPNLEVLNLNSCRSSDWNFTHIFNMKRLRQLDISYTSVLGTQFVAVMNHLPSLEVIYTVGGTGFNPDYEWNPRDPTAVIHNVEAARGFGGRARDYNPLPDFEGLNFNPNLIHVSKELSVLLKEGKYDVIAKYRKLGIVSTPNAPTCNGLTALHEAVNQNGMEDAIRYLVEDMKVDVDCVALGGNRPGSSAVPFGRKAAKRRQFGGELFLGHPGFLPFSISYPGFHRMREPDFVLRGQTPLTCAVRRGSLELITYLHKHGASLATLIDGGASLLHIAALSGAKGSMSALLKLGADPNTVDEYGFSPLHYCVTLFLPDNSAAKFRRRRFGERDGVVAAEPLSAATLAARKTCAFECIELLLSHGASISQSANAGVTPVMLAFGFGLTDAVTFLLKHGAELHACLSADWLSDIIAKNEASHANQSDVPSEQSTRLAKSTRETVNVSGLAGMSPLHLLVSQALNRIPHDYSITVEQADKLVNICLENGADLTQQNSFGATPLLAACSRPEFAEILLRADPKSISVNLADNDGVTPLHRLASIISTQEKTKTPMAGYRRHAYDEGPFAASATSTEKSVDQNIPTRLLKDLLQRHEIDVHQVIKQTKQTAFAIICSRCMPTPRNTLGYLTHPQDLDIVRMFLDRGADPTLADAKGWTPIHSLAAAGAHDLLKTLPKYDKSAFNARDSCGYTPLLAMLRIARDVGASALCAPVVRDVDPDALRRLAFPKSKTAVWYRGGDPLATGWALSIYLLVSSIGELSFFYTQTENGVLVAYWSFVDQAVPTEENIARMFAGSENFGTHTVVVGSGELPDTYFRRAGGAVDHRSEVIPDIITDRVAAMHTTGLFQTLRFLVENGADINERDTVDEQTILHHLAVTPMVGAEDIVRYLHSECNIKLNQRDFRGRTPFLYALEHANFKYAKCLMELGCDVSIPTRNGETALHVLMRKQLANYFGGVEKLSAPFSSAARMNKDELQCAITLDFCDDSSPIAVTSTLWNHETKRSTNVSYIRDTGVFNFSYVEKLPLPCVAMEVIMEGITSIVEKLVASAVFVKSLTGAKDCFGLTAMHYFAALGSGLPNFLARTPVSDFQTQDLVKAMRTEHPSFMDFFDHLQNQHLNWLTCLISAGYTPASGDLVGWNALVTMYSSDISSFSRTQHEKPVKRLAAMRSKVPLNVDNRGRGKSLATLMAGRDLTSDNDIAEINLPDRRIIASLACLPCDRSIQHAHLSNVIRNAIAKGYLGLVRALLESPLAADQSLLSPDMLLTVIQCPTFGPRATSNDDRAAIAQVLLNSGSNPNAIAEATGESALHIAIRNGYSATVGVLVDAKANVNAVVPESGQTPLHYAVTFLELGCSTQRYIVDLLIANKVDVTAADSLGNSAQALVEWLNVVPENNTFTLSDDESAAPSTTSSLNNQIYAVAQNLRMPASARARVAMASSFATANFPMRSEIDTTTVAGAESLLRQHMWDMFTKAAALAPRVHTIANAEAEAEAAAPAFGGNAREPPRGFGEGFGGGFFGAAQ